MGAVPVEEDVTGSGGTFTGRCSPRPVNRDGPFSRKPPYLSAGLEGAAWWVAGAAVACAEDADVEVAEVQRFLMTHGLLDEPS